MVKYVTIDSNIQLSIAFIVNCLLLTLSAALFFGTRTGGLGGFCDLYLALKTEPALGTTFSGIVSTLPAAALLVSGQNSTVTGVLVGQVVTEGFPKLSIPNWLRRLITWSLAVIPVITCLIVFKGNTEKIEQLLVFSQVFLSIALPSSLIPLQLTTSNQSLMDPFKNKTWINIISWLFITVSSGLNVYLITQTFQEL